MQSIKVKITLYNQQEFFLLSSADLRQDESGADPQSITWMMGYDFQSLMETNSSWPKLHL